MRTLDERSLEGRFGIGPFFDRKDGRSVAFTHRPDAIRRLAVAERLFLSGCAGEEGFGDLGFSLRSDERTAVRATLS
jgi:hypothetical protein